MKRTRRLMPVIIVFLAVAGYGYHPAHAANPEPTVSGSFNGPVATVRVTPIRKQTIREVITAYGTVVPMLGAVTSISVPFQSRVLHVLVTEGQMVSKGEDLVEIDPSADTRLKLEEAQSAYDAAQENLKKVRERVNLKVGTIEELLAAQQAYQEAQIRLENFKKRGIDENRCIRSKASGVVYKVHVREGTLVPAGTSFVDIVPQDGIEVRLGVEQEDARKLRLKEGVLVSPVETRTIHGAPGEIRMISRAVNPATRLVNIFVRLKSPGEFLLGEYVHGRITIASNEGLAVPRSAVLPEDGRYVLYTISQGRARKHVVQTGLENERFIEVVAKDLKPGEPVVVLGNYELKNGMRVRTEVPE